jgi:hypothetical protein
LRDGIVRAVAAEDEVLAEGLLDLFPTRGLLGVMAFVSSLSLSRFASAPLVRVCASFW